MAEPLLAASGIETGYGKVQVLWGAALDVKERESVVLLGANGAGKTTLLKVLLGLLPPGVGRCDWPAPTSPGCAPITGCGTECPTCRRSVCSPACPSPRTS